MYTCGPTVYDYAHIGNYRTFVFQDLLRRHLKYRGYQLKHVMNLTDVDDKTIRNSNAAGLSLREFTQKFIDEFMVDRDLLNLERPEFVVRATDHIPEMASLTRQLLDKGNAYESEGSVYFRVRSFPEYGKLSKINLSGNMAGARVDSDEYEKDDARDFVLWKSAKEGEPSWKTSVGTGRPGWHIECSAMAMRYLGVPFDIHSGGTDLIFPHHENEIAQSEAATGKMFARFWIHAEHLVVNGEKMSKSLGNFYTLRDLIARGVWPSAVRYLLASVPYHKPLNFTFNGLTQAQNSITRLRVFRQRLIDEPAGASGGLLVEKARVAQQTFEEAMDDNLNTAEAMAAVFVMVTEANSAMDRGEFNQADREACLRVLELWDRLFAVLDDRDYSRLRAHGLLREVAPEPAENAAAGAARAAGQPGSGNGARLGLLSDEEIESRVAARETARKSRQFAEADKIRLELDRGGVILEDTKGGTRWRRK